MAFELELRHRGRAGAQHGAFAAALEPRVAVREREQADAEADGEQRREPDETAVVPCSQCSLDRLDRGGEDVPQQEDQDPGRHGAEERPRALRERLHAPDREADEDREAGDSAEDEDLSLAHAGHHTPKM